LGSTLEFDAGNNVARWSLEGRVTDKTFSEGLSFIASFLAGTTPKSGIVDLSGVTSFEVSVSFLKEVASSEPILPTHLHRVIVAPTGHIYGLSRMFGILSEKTRPNLEIVRTMDEALKVLRIDAPNFQCIEPSAK